MDTINLTLLQLAKIKKSSKDFILYDLDSNNNMTQFKFTDDLSRYRNKYQHFKVLDLLKSKTKRLKIEL